MSTACDNFKIGLTGGFQTCANCGEEKKFHKLNTSGNSVYVPKNSLTQSTRPAQQAPVNKAPAPQPTKSVQLPQGAEVITESQFTSVKDRLAAFQKKKEDNSVPFSKGNPNPLAKSTPVGIKRTQTEQVNTPQKEQEKNDESEQTQQKEEPQESDEPLQFQHEIHQQVNTQEANKQDDVQNPMTDDVQNGENQNNEEQQEKQEQQEQQEYQENQEEQQQEQQQEQHVEVKEELQNEQNYQEPGQQQYEEGQYQQEQQQIEYKEQEQNENGQQQVENQDQQQGQAGNILDAEDEN